MTARFVYSDALLRPVPQPIPSTLVGWADLVNGSSAPVVTEASFEEVLLCTETASPLVSLAAPARLYTAEGAPLLARKTPTLTADGSTWRNKAIELVAASDGFANADASTVLDLTSDLTVGVLVRVRPDAGSNGSYVFGRGTANPFWALGAAAVGLGAAGRIRVNNTVPTTFESTTTSQLVDGAWHWLGFVYTHATTSIRVWFDGLLEGSAATLAGTYTQANSRLSLGRVGAIDDSEACQIACGFGVRAALANLQLSRIARQGKVPVVGAYPLTYTRGARYSCKVGRDADGDQWGHYGASGPQLAFGYTPNAEADNPLKVGYRSSAAKNQRVQNNCAMGTAPWVLTSCTATRAEGPDGMMSAWRLTPSLAAGKDEQNTAFAVPASGNGTYTVRVRRPSGAGDARITLFGTTAGSIARTLTAPTALWEEFEIARVMPGGLTGNIGVRIEPDITDGNSPLDVYLPSFFEFAGTLVNDVPNRCAEESLLTVAAAQVGADTALTQAMTPSDMGAEEGGEIEITFSLPYAIASDSLQSVLAALFQASTDRLWVDLDAAADVVRFAIQDAGATVADLRSAAQTWAKGTRHVVRAIWQRVSPLSNAQLVRLVVDGVEATAFTTTPTAPLVVPTASTLRIGDLAAGSIVANTIIERVRLLRAHALVR